MPIQRFRLQVDATGRGSLFDLKTGKPVDNVGAVTITARVGQATRVAVEFLAEAEAEVEVEAAEVELATNPRLGGVDLAAVRLIPSLIAASQAGNVERVVAIAAEMHRPAPP